MGSTTWFVRRWPAVPDAATPSELCERLAVAFTRVVRAAGIDVPVGATLGFAQALACVGLSRREHVYWAGRATLVNRPEEAEAFDHAFEAFWDRVQLDAIEEPAHVEEIVVAFDVPLPESSSEEDAAAAIDAPILTVRWSPAEVLRQRDFAAYTPDEFAEARRLIADLRFVGAMRPSRRRKPTRRRRGAPDLRRTVRRSFRAGGEPVSRALSHAITLAKSAKGDPRASTTPAVCPGSSAAMMTAVNTTPKIDAVRAFITRACAGAISARFPALLRSKRAFKPSANRRRPS